ncbi:ribokinase [Labrys monachus]|uniref:Ribokinase n=1 Tax=Labrys monachus TaxID=217067 RepID=A0ABU0FID2_9HYPH|nr:ribokinase [Labrys monachus]MDQ0394373.1 ribokinase [Labrys monachus]
MKVIVVGNCTVDLSFAVPSLPRIGETVLADGKTVDLGGKGANQAVVASRFGVESLLAAPIGLDRDGDWACERLAAEGLSPAALLRVEAPTDQSVIWVSADGENSIVSTHGAAREASPAWAEETLRRHAAPGDILLMQGNLTVETTRAALAAGRRAGMTTMLNPAPIQPGYEALLPLVDVAVLNRIEATVFGRHDDPLAGGASLRAAGVPRVIVTLGADGAVLMEEGGATRVPAPPVEAIDAVGAGDTLCGALAAALTRGASFRDALALAVEAASLTVTRKGTQTSFPTRAECAALCEKHAC